jgi:hypothetical protein
MMFNVRVLSLASDERQRTGQGLPSNWSMSPVRSEVPWSASV